MHRDRYFYRSVGTRLRCREGVQMKLLELLKDIPVLEANVSMDLEIGHVAYDSRNVKPGGMFVAIAGFASDGNRF
mgnify:CR=1 FL=1